jgi:hypothetical protein
MILIDYYVHSSIRIQSIVILYFGYIIYEHRPNPRLTMKIVQFATPLKKQPIAKERDGLTRECTPVAEKTQHMYCVTQSLVKKEALMMCPKW